MFDVIIIGGGIGGMNASYLLSKKFNNVLLIDERKLFRRTCKNAL